MPEIQPTVEFARVQGHVATNTGVLEIEDGMRSRRETAIGQVHLARDIRAEKADAPRDIALSEQQIAPNMGPSPH
jgi:hypothetical protein